MILTLLHIKLPPALNINVITDCKLSQIILSIYNCMNCLFHTVTTGREALHMSCVVIQTPQVIMFCF